MFIKAAKKKFAFVKDLLASSNTLLLKISLYIIPGSYIGTKYTENELVDSTVFY